jgi:hypothetical protein
VLHPAYRVAYQFHAFWVFRRKTREETGTDDRDASPHIWARQASARQTGQHLRDRLLHGARLRSQTTLTLKDADSLARSRPRYGEHSVGGYFGRCARHRLGLETG